MSRVISTSRGVSIVTVSDGTNTANIAFSGQYDAGGFHLASDGTTGTLITYTPSSLIPLDTTNHG